jgi:hypothetical protein
LLVVANLQLCALRSLDANLPTILPRVNGIDVKFVDLAVLVMPDILLVLLHRDAGGSGTFS